MRVIYNPISSCTMPGQFDSKIGKKHTTLTISLFRNDNITQLYENTAMNTPQLHNNTPKETHKNLFSYENPTSISDLELL